MRIDHAKELSERREQLVDLFRKAGEQLGNVIADFWAMQAEAHCPEPPVEVRTSAKVESAPPALLRKPEAARFLAISVRKLDRLRSSGDLSAVLLGGALRYSPEELQRFIRDNSHRSGGD